MATSGRISSIRKGREARAHGIVFGAAIEARLRIRAGAGDHAGIDEHADGDRHVAFMNQVVEHDGGLECAGLIDEVLPSWNTMVQAGFSGLYCAGT